MVQKESSCVLLAGLGIALVYSWEIVLTLNNRSFTAYHFKQKSSREVMWLQKKLGNGVGVASYLTDNEFLLQQAGMS